MTRARRAGLWVLCVCLGLFGFHAYSPTAAEGRRQAGTPLRFDEPVEGTLDDRTFRQIFTFAGQANQVIALSMSHDSGDLDPYLLLTDDRGTILALSDDDGPGGDARIAFKRIPADGTYFVIATRFAQELGSTSGDYTLLLERVGSSGESGSTALRYGDSVIDRVTADTPLVFYFMRAERGDVITIRMRRTSGNLDPRLDLATADGVVMVANDDDPLAEGTLDAGIVNYTVLETGMYLIVATRFGHEAGNTEGTFVLSLVQTDPEDLGKNPNDARLLDYGGTLDGEITDEQWTRYYSFDAKRGDVITATVAAGSGDDLDPLVRLLDPALTVLAEDNDGGDGDDARIAAFTLHYTGTYYLLVTRSGEAEGRTSGAYTVALTGRPGLMGGRALEIVYGASVPGQLDNQTVAEEYFFAGQEGDVIRITMERASGDLDSLVTLYDSDRKQISFDDDSGGDQNALIEAFTLPADGLYTLVASRYDREQGATSGAYLLSLQLVRAGR